MLTSTANSGSATATSLRKTSMDLTSNQRFAIGNIYLQRHNHDKRIRSSIADKILIVVLLLISSPVPVTPACALVRAPVSPAPSPEPVSVISIPKPVSAPVSAPVPAPAKQPILVDSEPEESAPIYVPLPAPSPIPDHIIPATSRPLSGQEEEKEHQPTLEPTTSKSKAIDIITIPPTVLYIDVNQAPESVEVDQPVPGASKEPDEYEEEWPTLSPSLYIVLSPEEYPTIVDDAKDGEKEHNNDEEEATSSQETISEKHESTTTSNEDKAISVLALADFSLQLEITNRTSKDNNDRSIRQKGSKYVRKISESTGSNSNMNVTAWEEMLETYFLKHMSFKNLQKVELNIIKISTKEKKKKDFEILQSITMTVEFTNNSATFVNEKSNVYPSQEELESEQIYVLTNLSVLQEYFDRYTSELLREEAAVDGISRVTVLSATIGDDLEISFSNNQKDDKDTSSAAADTSNHSSVSKTSSSLISKGGYLLVIAIVTTFTAFLIAYKYHKKNKNKENCNSNDGKLDSTDNSIGDDTDNEAPVIETTSDSIISKQHHSTERIPQDQILVKSEENVVEKQVSLEITSSPHAGYDNSVCLNDDLSNDDGDGNEDFLFRNEKDNKNDFNSSYDAVSEISMDFELVYDAVEFRTII